MLFFYADKIVIIYTIQWRSRHTSPLGFAAPRRWLVTVEVPVGPIAGLKKPTDGHRGHKFEPQMSWWNMWQIYWAKNTLKTLLPFQRQLRRLKRRVAGSSHRINDQSVYGGGFAQISFLAMWD